MECCGLLLKRMPCCQHKVVLRRGLDYDSRLPDKVQGTQFPSTSWSLITFGMHTKHNRHTANREKQSQTLSLFS